MIVQQTADGEQVYATASGRQIQVDDAKKVPTARRRRKAINLGIVLGFLVLSGLVVAAGILGVLMVIAEPPADDPDAVTSIGGYDPGVNPYLLTSPNFLGASLPAGAAVVIDGSRTSARWYDLAVDALLVTVGGSDPVNAMAVVAREGSPVLAPERPAPLAARRPDLANTLRATRPEGAANLVTAVEAARDAGARRIVLATSQIFVPEQEAALVDQLDALDLPPVDLILVNTDAPALAQWTLQRRGSVRSIPRQRIESWYRDARDVIDDVLAPPPASPGEASLESPAPTPTSLPSPDAASDQNEAESSAPADDDDGGLPADLFR